MRMSSLRRWLALAVVGAAIVAEAVAGAPVFSVDPSGSASSPSYSMGGVSFATLFDTASGSLEGWSARNINSLTVSGGLLTGTAASASPLLSFTFSNYPDLDLGFNDYVLLRLRLPNAYTGDVRVQYVSYDSQHTDLATQTVILPNSVLAKDGAMHSYRIDLSMEAWWRGQLRSISLQPVSASGQAFAIDCVLVGDIANDVLLDNTIDFPLDSATQAVVTSKHFRFVFQLSQPLWTTGVVRRVLCILQKSFNLYSKKLKWEEPTTSSNSQFNDGNRYRLNVVTRYSGAFQGGSPRGFAWLNLDPGYWGADPPVWALTNTVSHELMHTFQARNHGGGVPGPYFESHANYGVERTINEYAPVYQPSASNVGFLFARAAHFTFVLGRNYYTNYVFWLYLELNPDNYPDLGDGLIARVWHNPAPASTFYPALENATPQTSLDQILVGYARRGATLSYPTKDKLWASLTQSADIEITKRFMVTELVQRADKAGWWRVPFEMAPQQRGYTIHRLVPTGSGNGRVVTVNFAGLPDQSSAARWLVSFTVVTDNTGAERYTPFWTSGAGSVTLSANENTVYLSVVGAPAVTFTQVEVDEIQAPFRSDPNKVRFPYELQVTGAVPSQGNTGTYAGTSGLVRHANGGGWKSPSATVDSSAYIGPNARVLNSAVVRSNARIEDNAVVRDSAQVLDNAVVSGNAVVTEWAIVRDWARVRDYASLVGGAVVAGQARVLERAQIFGANIRDTATVKGNAMVMSPGQITGHSIIDGDYYRTLSVNDAYVTGGHDNQGDSKTTPLPDTSLARYDFAGAHDSLAIDSIGVTHGYLVNGPAWVRQDNARTGGFLSFAASGQQYLSLPRNVAELTQLTFAAWIKPAASSFTSPVLFSFGNPAAARRAVFTHNDGTGNAVLSYTISGTTTIVARTAVSIPTSSWTHVAITLSGTAAELYVNGVRVATGAPPQQLRPEQLLADNTGTSGSGVYIGGGMDAVNGVGSHGFVGSVDTITWYASVLDAASIASLATPPVAPPRQPTSPQPAASAVLAYYPALQNLGDSVGSDFSGKNAAAQLTGTLTFTNTAWDLNGNTYLQTPVPNGATRSLSAWIYPRDVSQGRVFDSDVPSQYGSGWGVANGAIEVMLNNEIWSTGVAVTINTWQHVLLAFDSGNAIVYLNGVRAASRTYTQRAVSVANYVIGHSLANNVPFFNGLLRELRIHNRVVTAAEAQQIANTDSPTQPR